MLVMGQVSFEFMARRCGSFHCRVGWEGFWGNKKKVGPMFGAHLGSLLFGPHLGPFGAHLGPWDPFGGARWPSLLSPFGGAIGMGRLLHQGLFG